MLISDTIDSDPKGEPVVSAPLNCLFKQINL